MRQITDPIEKENYAVKYVMQQHFFPIIAAVLKESQKGLVFVSSYNVNNYLIIHKFGFAQMLVEEESFHDFCKEVYEYLKSKIVCGGIELSKIRFYNAHHKFIETMRNSVFIVQVGERIRFKQTESSEFQSKSTIASLEELQALNAKSNLDLFSRFWESKKDLISKGMPYVCKRDGEVVSICYGAATENGYSEIDVYTDERYRNKGLAKEAVVGFLQNCKEYGITPLWDCYSNNLGSVKTAIAVGFAEVYKYDFLILTK